MLFYLKKSFTLVELSIVLSVLALLTTIVLSSAKIINTAKSLKVIKEISNYREAIEMFYKQFNSFPGDYEEAQYRFAPKDYTTVSWTSISRDDSVIGRVPHNGNQDGIISNAIINEDGIYYSEVFGVWSHLSANNLIDTMYSNVCKNVASGVVDGCAKGNYNLPLISEGINSNSVYVFYKPNEEDSNDKKILGQVLNDNYIKNNHILLMVDISHSYSYKNTTSLDRSYVIGGGGGINSSLMFIVDNKIDDGKPLSGNVFGLNGSNDNNKMNVEIKDGQCNTYKGDNSGFNENNAIKRENIVYSNDSNKSCIGVIVFN